VETSCTTTAGGQNMLGIYNFRAASGAQIVTVRADMDYRSVLGAFGFRGVGMKLAASSQAAVTGI
jgi:hypothetical protein